MSYNYHKIITMKEACVAFTDWLAKQQTRTMPSVVYVSQDLVNGTFVLETDFPIPEETEDDEENDDEEEEEEEDRQWDDIALIDLELSPRASNILKHLNVSTAGEMYDKILAKGYRKAIGIPGVGANTLRHMAYVIRKAMKGLVIDGVYYAPAKAEFIDYIGKVYKLQFGVDDVYEERNDE